MVGDGERWVMWQLECCRYVKKKAYVTMQTSANGLCSHRLHLNTSLVLLFAPSLFIYSTTIIAITTRLVY